MGMFYGHNCVSVKYGLLYNWYAASDPNFAPSDWEVPTFTDFSTLASYIGGDEQTLAVALKEVGRVHWMTANGSNSSNFTALGAGSRSNNGSFSGLKESNFIWTTDIYLTPKAKSIYISNNGPAVCIDWWDYYTAGLSVRLIYRGAGSPTSITDYDGNIYNVITIGTQKWLKQNWKCTHLNDGTTIPEVTDYSNWGGLSTGALCAYNNDWNYV